MLTFQNLWPEPLAMEWRMTSPDGPIRALAAMAMIALAILFTGVPLTKAVAATVIAHVDLGKQRMSVSIDGVQKYSWRVSTGLQGMQTPIGSYTPFALTPYYYSKKWKMALPYLVSIDDKGTAIHGTSMTSKLGRPASHGCIRLDTANAATFYKLIEANGMSNTQVIVSR